MSHRYLLDTNALGDFLFDRYEIHLRIEQARRSGARIGTCPPVLAEVWFGVENSRTRDANIQLVRLGIQSLTIWPFDTAAAREYGRLAADLRRRGRPMQTVDVQMAAVALTLGRCTVVTADADLVAIPGLPVENWRVAQPNP